MTTPIVRPEECLPTETLIAMRPDAVPRRGEVKTDEELDAVPVPLSVMPPASWRYMPPAIADEHDPVAAAAAAAVGGGAPLPPE